MKKQTLQRIIRQIREAADAISEIDDEIIKCLAENGCDIPMPQQLDEVSDRLEPIVTGGGSSRVVAQDENPGKKIYVDSNHKSYAL